MGAQPVGLSTLNVGDARVTHVPDGYLRADALASFPDSTAEDWHEHPELLDESGRLVMTLGAILVELPTGERALLDTGFGPRSLVLDDDKMDFWGGRLLRSLAAAGLGPEDIDAVLYSHLHLDHVGWTSRGPGRALTFPNARHIMSRAEWDHWFASTAPGRPSGHDFAALEPRVELLDEEAEPLPGLRVVPTPGHTAGHCSFLVKSGTEQAVVLGDAIHCPLQISNPEWAYLADADPAAAVRSRNRILRELDDPGSVVVGPHFPDAIFGRVVPGSTPRQVAFDVAPAVAPQRVGDDAQPGVQFPPPLAD